MTTSYRGHEISVTREKSMGGWSQVFFSVFRESDQYECVSGFSDSADTVRTWIRLLRERIDDELSSSTPWGCELPC